MLAVKCSLAIMLTQRSDCISRLQVKKYVYIKTHGRVSVAKKAVCAQVCYLWEPLTRHFQPLVSL